MSEQMLACLRLSEQVNVEVDLILNGCYIAIRISGCPVSLSLDMVVRFNVHRAAERASRGEVRGELEA